MADETTLTTTTAFEDTLWNDHRQAPTPSVEYAGNTNMDMSNIGLPIAVTLLVVIVLCMVIAYTKARRRANALGGSTGTSNHQPMSGGPPMSKFC